MCLSSEVLLFVVIDIVVEDCCRYLLFSSVPFLIDILLTMDLYSHSILNPILGRSGYEQWLG